MTLSVRLDIDRQKLTVELAQQLVGAGAVKRVGEDLDLAVDDRVLRHGAQPGHLGVVAHLEHERRRGRAVGPGLEEQGVAVVVELG